MAASREDILGWLQEGKAKGATHVIIVCDTYDYEDYPVVCNSKEEALAKANNPGSMQRVMEVYDLSLPIENQLKETRAYHI